MVAFINPLPLGEREGPAAARQWEGEGTTASITALHSAFPALTLPCSAWAPPSPPRGEG